MITLWQEELTTWAKLPDSKHTYRTLPTASGTFEVVSDLVNRYNNPLYVDNLQAQHKRHTAKVEFALKFYDSIKLEYIYVLVHLWPMYFPLSYMISWLWPTIWKTKIFLQNPLTDKYHSSGGALYLLSRDWTMDFKVGRIMLGGSRLRRGKGGVGEEYDLHTLYSHMKLHKN